MEPPGSNFLMGLATICITFVSVSTVAFVFRQAAGPGPSELEVLLVRTFIRTGLGATIFALLPLVLGWLGILPILVWRAASLALALAHLNAVISYLRRRAHLGPLAARQLATRRTSYTLFALSFAVVVGLLVNAIGIGVQPGLYMLGATWILVESMVMFMLALRIFLEPLGKRES